MSRTNGRCGGGLSVVGALAAVLLAACVSTQESGARAEQSRITAEELSEVRANNLYQAVERLRPRWLSVRSSRSFEAETAIVVYQRQTRLGGPEILRSMSTNSVRWLEYMDGPEASASLPGISRGTHIEGAIILHTSGDGSGGG